MLTQRQAYLNKALLGAVAVLLLLTTTEQSAILTNSLPTTATSPLSNGTVTTQLNNSSREEPLVLRLHRPCRSEHENFCENGGKCMYPQDSDRPSCICTSSYSGPRCLFLLEPAQSGPELEKLIGISLGVAILVIGIAVIIYCFAWRRCMKSAPLIKSAPSEISV
ncbi:hypothetical protein Q5P01_015102 [Channa striata]|uniref:EGF-like domain-containing protein n=1 Tax=Channa striata TaxID=64152 RepID=A0AA88SG02_CHASR|nr:hypothetical protein Q5P01_015102 [Channa striata]